MEKNIITRKKAARIFLWVALIAWLLPFVIAVIQYAPDLFNVENLINDGLSKEDIQARQFGIAITFVFIFPPVFIIGAISICGIYHLITGNCTRVSIVIRLLYIIVSLLTLFSFFSWDSVVKLIHLTGNKANGVIMFLSWIVLGLDIILELTAFNLDRRQFLK